MNEEIAFWILSAIAVLGALVAVRKRNLIHGVFALLVFFAGLSGLFLLLLAEFIAAVQVLVYIGAVGVLLLFAIMLTERVAGDDGRRMTSRGWPWGLVAAVAGLFCYCCLASSTVINAESQRSIRILNSNQRPRLRWKIRNGRES